MRGKLWRWCKHIFFVSLGHDCLRKMMLVKAIIEVVVELAVLVWQRYSLVWG